MLISSSSFVPAFAGFFLGPAWARLDQKYKKTEHSRPVAAYVCPSYPSLRGFLPFRESKDFILNWIYFLFYFIEKKKNKQAKKF
jgi:hypothetical protein